jgi:hypothetical protein
MFDKTDGISHENQLISTFAVEMPKILNSRQIYNLKNEKNYLSLLNDFNGGTFV